ncbi:MAG: phosphatase PAP2 family protein [Chloroflexi bacterium]|nr:phosphatase PAP2 family protein [Chloroflexota bacterium]
MRSSYATRLAEHTYSTPLLLLLQLSVAGAVLLSLLAAFHSRLPGDVAVVRGVQDLSTPWLDDFMKGIALFGTKGFVIGSIAGIGAILTLFRRWREAVLLWLILIPEGFLQLLKAVIDRPRPTEDLVRVLDPYASGSFPSGHTYHALLLMGLLLLFSATGIRNRWLRNGVMAIFSSLILFTAVSRLYLGAHWPSDIIGSALFAIPTLFVLYSMYRMMGGHLSAPERRALS